MIDQHASAKPQGAALVTGAARRIGRAIALDLAHAGWPVAVHYHRSADDAAAVVAEIEGAGGRAVALACDLAKEDEVETLVPRAGSALGPLACLVNNASVFEMDKIENIYKYVKGRADKKISAGRPAVKPEAGSASSRS